MNPEHPQIRVIGVGSPLMGDDGFGPRVIQELQRRGDPEGVEAVDAGVGGLTLIGLLEGADRVLLIDAARMGEPPGTLRVFPLKGGGAAQPAHLSLHEISLRPVLDFADALGIRPEMVLLGVEPEVVAPGCGLSPAVEKAVPKAIELALEYVEAICGGAEWAPEF